jgi:methionyl-tRNA formyltransferase
VEQVDAGDILSRVRLNPDSLRNYYQYTSDTIRLAIEEFPQVLIQFANQELSAIPQEVSERKYLYRKADFTDSALREVLNKYGI